MTTTNRSTIWLASVFVAALATTAFTSTPVTAQGSQVPGAGTVVPGVLMGPGVVMPHMMHMQQVPAGGYSKDQVRQILIRRIQSQGYSRLKIGKLEEKSADTIAAEIVTTDGALVQKLEVNRQTGLMRETN